MKMKKWLIRPSLFLITLFGAMAIWVYTNIYDRHPGYEVNLHITGAAPGELQAGFAALPITPKIEETWRDNNADAEFHEKDGDTYADKNANGKFDAYWLAGFGHRRAANGVHDDLWARAMVIDDGNTCLALVALDAIGIFHDVVVDIRKNIPAAAGIDYAVIMSTHDHEAPDLMGLWGESDFKSGVNPEYLAHVKRQAAQAAITAAKNRRPAKLKIAQDLANATEFVMDSRPPIVLDSGLRLIQALDAEADTTLGVLVSWANHPETLWSKNLLITSDFPHYVRESLEKGIEHNGELRAPGLGGIAVYANGAIGGLMTTDTDFAVKATFADTVFTAPTFEKAQAQGEHIALLALQALQSDSAQMIETGAIRLRAKTFDLPLDNKLFRLAAMLGVVDRGFSGWMQIRSEVAAWTLGSLSFACIPGEIYPELINGGIEAPSGRDFEIDPLETPSIRSVMPGDFKFIFGLANDEIGYIIPKSEWDEKPPYLYEAAVQLYGEINSVGPETAPIIHKEILAILKDLKTKN
jgi:hypothetical protein